MDDYLYHYQQNEFSICNRYSEDTVEYYELAILNSYFIYPFLSLKAISLSAFFLYLVSPVK